MTGRLYFATVGSDLAAVWHSAYGPRAKLGELERAHGAARLIWSMPGSPKAEAAVHAAISQYRAGDQNLFKMTANQVADLIDRIKGVARRETRELQAASWIKRVAASAAQELRQLEREENDPVDTRGISDEEWEEEARCADEVDLEDLEMDLAAEIEAVEAAGGNLREYFEELRRQWFKEALSRLSPDYGRPGGAQAVNPDDWMQIIDQIIDGIRARGITSLNGIARELNLQNVNGVRHGRWHATTVRKFLARAKHNP
jgi:hypothetical protein